MEFWLFDAPLLLFCNISLKHFEDLNLIYYIILISAGIYYHHILF